MTSAVQAGFPGWREADDRAESRTGPNRKRSRAPLFIQDAVLPFAGETMLSAQLRADLSDLEGKDQP